MKLPGDTFERIYAGWLGKIVGIRMGSAIEGWTYERIKDVFGELWDYPVAYRNFAADDDSNGPLFFVRALERCRDIRQFSASDVAWSLLNYAPFEHGFFWWGGYGVSTEHTAYLNLRNGIPAPRSGSSLQNGSTMAEQIGGQIFIDPWGLVSPGNPVQAAYLAERAASVTHDGNGIYGGIFLACAISLSFVEKDIASIIDKALGYIPKDCEYARVVKAVIAFHDEHPDDWRQCYKFIYDNYGYDKYPGMCHIIPNAAVMILSLLYGNGDFSKTLCICNMCGWDTDCNVGNLGSIMGVYCGLDGIDYEKWRVPINDFLACSCAVPSMNATDIPSGAAYMASMAYRLAGETPPEPWKSLFERDVEISHFEFPGSTHAIRTSSSAVCHIRNTDEAARSGKRSLKLTASMSGSGDENFFYKQSYYGSCDFDNSRYDPFFSPLAYPGQTLHASLLPVPVDGFEAFARLYAKNGTTGEIFRGEKINSDGVWHDLSLTIPGGQAGYISEIGVILCGVSSGRNNVDLAAYLDDMYVDGAPDYMIGFSGVAMDIWTPLHQEVPQFGRLKGHTYLDGGFLSLSCADFGEMYTGHHSWRDYSISCVMRPLVGDIHLLLARVQGAMSSYAAGFYKNGSIAILKNDSGYMVVKDTPFPWETDNEYQVKIIVRGATVTLEVDGSPLLSWEDPNPITSGCAGIAVQHGSHCLYRDFEIKG